MQQQTKPTILIVGGSGRMGQWFKNFFESHGIPVTTHGRKSQKKLSVLVHQSDIVIISVPISQVSPIIKQVIPHMRKNALLTDLTSLKTLPLKAMATAECGTLGMHPLFGPSVITAQNQKIVFCHQKDNAHVKFLHTLFEVSGMEAISLDAKEHDQQMAMIQGLTHAMSILFAKTIKNSSFQLDDRLQTPLFTLQSLTMMRALQQDPELIADIELFNPHFLSIIKSLHSNTTELLSLNTRGDRESLLQSITDVRSPDKTQSDLAIQQTNRVLQLLQEQSVKTSSPQSSNVIGVKSVAYLGPEGTNTHQAARQAFPGKNVALHSHGSLADIFKAVEKGNSDVGLVPAENSIHGTIQETLDLLSTSFVKTAGSTDIPIHHALLSLESDTSEIARVLSHPQALAQCKLWLQEHLPHALRVSTMSTTAALNAPKPHEAYIANVYAGAHYAIPVIAKNIEDQTNNTTRFYVISKKAVKAQHLSQSNTLIYLTILNRVGILRDILDIFAKHGISLNKLESRPSSEKIWDYCFYIEVDKNPTNKELVTALAELENLCASIRVLGMT